MDDFKGSPSALVADVDCTADGKALCEKHGVTGYPTIKWGDPGALEDYNGGRDYSAIKKHADDNLGPTCGPDNLDLCDDAEKKFLQKFAKWDQDELDLRIEEEDAKVAAIEKKSNKITEASQSQITALQAKITKENKNKEAAIAKANKKAGYKFMKDIANPPKKSDDDDADFDDLDEEEPEEAKEEAKEEAE